MKYTLMHNEQMTKYENYRDFEVPCVSSQLVLRGATRHRVWG